MSETKHTPGPWSYTEVEASEGLAMHRFNGSDGQGFAYTVGLSKEVDRANARLIASAPELLESLRRVKAAFEEPKQDIEAEHNAINAAYKHVSWAIAKAEGR